MEYSQTERLFEEQNLAQTIALAGEQLAQAEKAAEKKQSEIMEAKKDIRENATHGYTNLYSADDFEALVELSQYISPVTDKLADYEENENKIRLLKKLVQSPYFARIDFRFEDEEEPEKIYIGRGSLKEYPSHRIAVYDWRSPVASVFYRFASGKACYDAPNGKVTGELSLKRQYEIKNSTLQYFFDADVQIIDEFLRQLLSQNTSPKMKAIVETIQRDQDAVIRDMENDLLMVQGAAGSGKTSIALHRTAYLMYRDLKDSLSAENIMILSPNPIFEQYISGVLPELGERNVVYALFDELLSGIIKKRQLQNRNNFLEKLILHSPHRAIRKSSVEFKASERFMGLLDRFIEDIPHRFIDFFDVFFNGSLIADSQTMKNKILARRETPIGVKLAQLEEYLLELLCDAAKKCEDKTEFYLLKQKIEHLTHPDASELYQRLFCEEKYFYSLLRAEPDEEVRAIWRYTKENLQSPYLLYDDAIAIAYLHLRLYGSDAPRNIRQVVIDEAQDYYPLQYSILFLLFPRARFTVLGDVSQTIEKQEDLSLYEQIGRLFNRKRVSLITLNKSFRCTDEILRFSLKLLENPPDIESFSRSGDKPQVIKVTDYPSLVEGIGNEIHLCLEKGYSSIGLICRTEKSAARLFRVLQDKVELRLIRGGSKSDLTGVSILPVYVSKGLEFDAVLLCDADENSYFEPDDRNLLYVGCTRALHRLTLFSLGRVSPFITE